VSRFPALALVAVALAAAAGCSSDRSYAHVTVRTMSGELTDVAQLIVYVNNDGTNCDTLYYPKAPAARAPDGPFRLAPDQPLDFSVSFKTFYQGSLRIGVDARNVNMDPIAYGEVTKPIDPGHVVKMDIALVIHALSPPIVNKCLGSNALVCTATDVASCGAGQSCHVTCAEDRGVSLCRAAGSRKAGERCSQGAGECEPGTQCFEYPCGSPRTAVCLKFCKEDGECGGGACAKVECRGKQTEFGTCSLGCDPRPSATDGCPAGLGCFIFAGEKARCDCEDASRQGENGAVCKDARDCKRGFLCVASMNAKQCRPVCRLDDGLCPSGGTCTKLMDPDYKVWGACLP
jgi:hypothetical protein